jgi:cell division protein FtsN
MRAYRKIENGDEGKVEPGRLVLLVIGGVLTLVLVFLVGLLVGKGLWAGPGEDAPPVAQTTGRPEPPPANPSPKYTFYDDLKRPDSQETPLTAAPGGTRGKPDSATTSLVVPRPEAAAEPQPVETLIAPRPEPPAPVRRETPVATAPAKPKPALEASKATADLGAAGRPSPLPASPRVDAPLPAPSFTVQVASYKERGPAEAQARQLAGEGVSAQVIAVPIEGRTWYRVQVGRFGTRAEAEEHFRNKLKPKGVVGFVTTR